MITTTRWSWDHAGVFVQRNKLYKTQRLFDTAEDAARDMAKEITRRTKQQLRTAELILANARREHDALPQRLISIRREDGTVETVALCPLED